MKKNKALNTIHTIIVLILFVISVGSIRWYRDSLRNSNKRQWKIWCDSLIKK